MTRTIGSMSIWMRAFSANRLVSHPNENIATVFLAADDLVALLRRHGAIVDPIHV